MKNFCESLCICFFILFFLNALLYLCTSRICKLNKFVASFHLSVHKHIMVSFMFWFCFESAEISRSCLKSVGAGQVDEVIYFEASLNDTEVKGGQAERVFSPRDCG